MEKKIIFEIGGGAKIFTLPQQPQQQYLITCFKLWGRLPSITWRIESLNKDLILDLFSYMRYWKRNTNSIILQAMTLQSITQSFNQSINPFHQCFGSVSFWYGSGSYSKSDLKSRKYQLLLTFFFYKKYIYPKYDLFQYQYLFQYHKFKSFFYF